MSYFFRIPNYKMFCEYFHLSLPDKHLNDSTIYDEEEISEIFEAYGLEYEFTPTHLRSIYTHTFEDILEEIDSLKYCRTDKIDKQVKEEMIYPLYLDYLPNNRQKWFSESDKEIVKKFIKMKYYRFLIENNYQNLFEINTPLESIHA